MAAESSSRRSLLGLVRKTLRYGGHFIQTGYLHSRERCCEDFPDENFVNHLKVYKFALQFCNSKDVLDVGCGTGYGSSCLAELAASVVGIDLSRQALRYAQNHYRSPSIRFLHMNAERLEFPDRSFDFVISTENFEHLRDQRANLREMSRVLKSDGTLLLATPNHEMFIGIDNPFHTHELTYEEFLGSVQEFFSECVIAENLLEPLTEEGLGMKEDRRRRGALGADLFSRSILWGDPIDTTWLSNTHSFFCFARHPK